jgi:hypothetical protein
MLKNILNLKGAQQLSKKEQNTINGGTGCIEVTQGQCYGMCPAGNCLPNVMWCETEAYFYEVWTCDSGDN